MTRGLTPPSVTGDLSSLKKRVTDLERKLDAFGKTRPYLGTPFSLAGAIYVSESPPWTTPVKLTIVEIVGLLGTAGSTTTTVALKVNGTTIVSLNIAAGEQLRKLTTSKILAPDQDVVTIACTAAGEGAEDLDVIVRVL